MCSPWLPLEELKGSWRDQNSSNFGKNTHSTHGKWKGINLSTTTKIQLFVSPLALNKEGRERSCSGSPLGSSGVTCMRPGYNQHQISSWLFGFCTLAMSPWGAEESITEVPLEYQGGAWLRADQRVHISLWSGRASPSVPGCELWAFSDLVSLNSGPFFPSGSTCLTWARKSGIPGPSFLKVIN